MESGTERGKSSPECDIYARRWVASVLGWLLPAETLSFITEPNLESGANVDCCKLYRENKAVSLLLMMMGIFH
jgi:hypothetical protein